MASKKDLVEAQTFSRRRLLTAFVSGAPGGRELEPTKPLRAVATGVGLALLVVLGSLAAGKLMPAAPADWDDNRLVVVSDSGSRYVALQGVLYPVLNTASARLVLTGGLAAPVRVSAADVADHPRGPTLGIPGAPDTVPEAADLVRDGWLSCVAPDGSMLTVLSDAAPARAVTAELDADAADGTSTAVLVEAGGTAYVVTEGRRYAVPPEGSQRVGVLRALGMETVDPWPVPAAWLNLFAPGAELVPFDVTGAGAPVPNSVAAPPGAVVGAVVHLDDAGTQAQDYVITADGGLAPLSPLALAVYRSVSDDLPVLSATVAATSAMPIAESAAPADWPTQVPELVGADLAACGQLSTELVANDAPTPVRLGAASVEMPTDGAAHVLVDPDAGALVLPVAGATTAEGFAQLVDASGTAFALPGADADVLSRLGFTPDDVTRVPQAWLALFAVGPELTVQGALQQHGASDPALTPTPAPVATPTPTATAADGVVTGVVTGTAADSASPAPAQGCDTDEPQYVRDPPPALARLAAETAWQRATGAGVVVAVVDSGVDRRNVHLGDAVLPGVDLVPGSGGDPNGWTDPAGHGTAIAGIIAGRPYESGAERSGAIGLAPEATILPVRVYVDLKDKVGGDKNLAPDATRIAEGIRFAADAGARIINVSMSTTAEVDALAAAVQHATDMGALVVASAGNSDTTDALLDQPRYPAAYPGVLGVSAVTDTDAPAPASIAGPQVAVAAPGTNVLTSFLDKGDCILGGQNGSSSFATAYVSAAAALVAQAYPDETPAQWAYRLEVTASRPQADRRDDALGWGVIRPAEALAFVDDGTAPGPVSPTFGRQEPVAVPTPDVTTSVRTDQLAPVRASTAWWALGCAVAVTGAVLASFPALRRRRRRS